MAYDPIYAHEYYLKHKKKKKGTSLSTKKSGKSRSLVTLETMPASKTRRKKKKSDSLNLKTWGSGKLYLDR